MDMKNLPSGFEIVASDSVPSITLDKQRRFYLNTSARRLIGVKPYERLALAYSPAARKIAIIRPGIVPSGKEHSELATSNYSIDKRFYMSARHFSRRYAFDPAEAPYSFAYEQGDPGGAVFIFRLIR